MPKGTDQPSFVPIVPVCRVTGEVARGAEFELARQPVDEPVAGREVVVGESLAVREDVGRGVVTTVDPAGRVGRR
jgi:hypothetical protein